MVAAERKLFVMLDKQEIEWVLTDLVKCFVFQKKDKENNINGSKNMKVAITHCSSYLQQQISILQPKIIVGLGKRVHQYFIPDSERVTHGLILPLNNNQTFICSVFPSQNNADDWASCGEWKPIFKLIQRILNSDRTSFPN